MSKLAFVSDVHLSSQNPVCRKDDLRSVQWDKLNFVYDTAALAYDCTAVVFAGDLVDVACSWSLLPELAEFLSKRRKAINTWTVFGQHDTYMYNAIGRRKTIVGSLAAAGLLSVVGDPNTPFIVQGGAGRWVLHGASYGQPPEEPLTTAEQYRNILITHAPISDQALWEGQSYFDAKRFLAEHPKYDLIVCGDIHRAFNISIGKRRIINTGPLLRRKADEAEQRPHFYILDLDSGKLEKVPVPHSVAEEVISREHIEQERAYDRLLQQLQTPVDSTADAASTAVHFEDTLREVAASNVDKINSNVVRLVAEITGVNLKQETTKRGKQKAASRR
jgi:DNA repair exonuclease SbcCD nuclease subunit